MSEKQDDLRVGIASIGEIFGFLSQDTKDNKKFENLNIPNYQRPYRWTIQNADELIEDILEAIDNDKSSYLIGNIVLHDNDNKTLDIIDGQQRLTTLALILKACEVETNFLQQKINPNSKNALIRNFNFIKAKLSQNDITNFIKDKLQVTYCIVKTIDEAFDIFDTQNSRGKELTEPELLKNHHFLHLKADDIIKQEIAKKYKYYQNKDTWWENYSLIESTLNELYIARQIFNGKYFRLGKYVDWKDMVFDEFIGIKDKGYTRINELKFNSNIIKGNEYFIYLFKYANMFELLFEKTKFSDKYYINQSMMIMLLIYVDKFGIDKNFDEFFYLVFVYLFAVLSYYSQIRYNCKWLINEGDMTILKRIYNFINSSDFSSLLIEKLKKDIEYGFEFGNSNGSYIEHPNGAYEKLTSKTKEDITKEYIEKISFEKITFKDKK